MSASGDVIRQAYDAFARGDIPAVIDVLADDVSWTVPALVPQGGTANGKQEVGGFFEQLGSLYEDFGIDVQDFVDGEDHVVGVGVAQGKLRTGRPVDYGFVHVFDVSDGRVTRFREYVDRSVG